MKDEEPAPKRVFTPGQKLFYVNASISKVYEYTYCYALELPETPFNKSLHEQDKPTFEQHIILEKEGSYEVVSTEDLQLNYFETAAQAIEGKYNYFNNQFNKLNNI